MKIITLCIVLLISLVVVSADNHIPAEIKAQCRAADNPPECLKALGYQEDEPESQEYFKEEREFPLSPEEWAEEKRREEEFKKRYDARRNGEEEFQPEMPNNPRPPYDQRREKRPNEQQRPQEQQELDELRQEVAQLREEQMQQRSELEKILTFLKRIFSFNLWKEE